MFPAECPRCGGQVPVLSPREVQSWLDEVKEREAFDQIIDYRPGDQHAPPRGHAPAFEDEIDYRHAAFLSSIPFFNSSMHSRHLRSHPRAHSLDVLRCLAHGFHLRHGWDGSPAELQPSFQQHAFLTTAHHFGQHEAFSVVVDFDVDNYQAVPVRQALPSDATTTSTPPVRHKHYHQMLRRLRLLQPARC